MTVRDWRWKNISFVALFILSFSIIGLWAPQKTNALAGNQFNAGRIMDDSVFFSANTMDNHEIQRFLNAKVPNCDTNGAQQHSSGSTRAAYATSKGYPGPYTCLKDYRQDTPAVNSESGTCSALGAGNKSAADIIYLVAQACGINPKVLIVLLQKEQSLITDDWPWAIQYRSATGYGCPDTAACDSQYYGFFNQVYSAARQFKRYAKTPTSYNYRNGRTSHVGYNPTASCGGSNVSIQTQATAGLYNYTPYQPNQAALNNLYGSGDNCSAYGNRNFWRMFNDWFGPSVGPLIKTDSSGELFYSDGSSKYRVGSMDMVGLYGLGGNDVRIISQAEMDTIPVASSPNTSTLSYVTKSNSDGDADGGSIYVVTIGKRYLISSMDLFADYGFKESQIGYMPLTQLERMPLVGTLEAVAKSNDGTLYKVQDGVRRAILDLATFQQTFPSGSVSAISDYILGNITLGPALLTQDIALATSDGRLWLANSSGWRYISSMEQYTCMGLERIINIPISNFQSTVGTQLDNASCIVQSAGGSKYLLDNWRRIPIDAGWGFGSAITVSDNLLNRLSVYSPTQKPVFRTISDGTLYAFSGGQKRHVINMTSFERNGYVANDIFVASSSFLSTIAAGGNVLGDGMIVRDASTGKLYIIAGNGKYAIPNMDIFNNYGYDGRAIIDLQPEALSGYPTTATLQSQLAFAPGATVFDSGIALQIPSNIEGAFGFSGSTPTYHSAIASSGSVRQGTRYLKFGSSAQLYYMENGTKRPVYSWDIFVSLGGSTQNITGLSAAAGNLFPTGSAVQ